MSHNPNTVKSQDDLIKKAFENQNDDLIKNALNSGYIKSQDDLNPCNNGKRSSDVVLSAVEKCELLQKQLDIAKSALRKYTSKTALTYNDGTCYALRPYNDNGREAQKALDDIEALNEIPKQE